MTKKVVMNAAAAALLLGAAVVLAHDSSGMAHCDLSQLPVIEDFDLNQFAGAWHLYKATSLPQYYENAAYEISLPVTVEEGMGGEATDVIMARESVIYKSKRCVQILQYYDVDRLLGTWTSGYNMIAGKGLMRVTERVFATDYISVAGVYREVSFNGVTSPYSSVRILVRDSIPPNLNVVSSGLTAFCGPSAVDADSHFFQTLAVDAHKMCHTRVVFKFHHGKPGASGAFFSDDLSTNKYTWQLNSMLEEA